MDYIAMSDEAILKELGERIRQQRLNQNIAQIELAGKAGVSRSMVQKLEQGEGCMLRSIIRVLRALGILEQLDSFLPYPGISPLQLARLKTRKRQRASGNNKTMKD